MSPASRFASQFTFAVFLCVLLANRATAQVPTLVDLYHFTGGADGGSPMAELIQARDGMLYGTAESGGAGSGGTIFRIGPDGKSFSVFFTFPWDPNVGHPDGAAPEGGLIQDAAGNFYGTAWAGGDNWYDPVTGAQGSGEGTAYKIAPDGTATLLHSFDYIGQNGIWTNPDGVALTSALVRDSLGNLYGTTYVGGNYGAGVVFRIGAGGGFAVLHHFNKYDGLYPSRTLLLASDGNLYGTTYYGGATYDPVTGWNGEGVLYRIATDGTGFTLLHSFKADGHDGSLPYSSLIQARDGNIYGATKAGGSGNLGTIFRLAADGTPTILYSFDDLYGAGPVSLMQASDGKLYGTGIGNGGFGYGSVFTVAADGTAFATLHKFTQTDGSIPLGSLIQAANGNFYGTAGGGGLYGNGVVYRLSGVYPLPVISGLSPSSRDAGAPAFTLAVKGSSFQPFTVVDWNGAPLATTYVSPSELKASVPATFTATPGKASITVVTGSGGGVSNTKVFTTLVTTLKLTSASLVRNSDGTYSAKVSLKNIGYLTAPSVNIKLATLGGAATTTTVPINLGDIAPGATVTTTLSFPASAGPPGTVVVFKTSASFTGGSFTGSLKVTLP